MSAAIPTHPEVLLVGSVALQSAEDVFRTVSATLGDRVRRIPDGETGPRSLWVFWPRRVLERNAARHARHVGGRGRAPLDRQ
jgi:hypothetical protein